MSSIRRDNVTYTLFLYREELRRNSARRLKLTRTKLSLTDELISRSVRNLKNCSMDDLNAITRELSFKKKLNHELKRLKNLKKKDEKNYIPNTQSETGS